MTWWEIALIVAGVVAACPATIFAWNVYWKIRVFQEVDQKRLPDPRSPFWRRYNFCEGFKNGPYEVYPATRDHAHRLNHNKKDMGYGWLFKRAYVMTVKWCWESRPKKEREYCQYK